MVKFMIFKNKNLDDYSCPYIEELNELEAQGYSQEEALAMMEYLCSQEHEDEIQMLMDISKRIENLKKQGMTQEQALAEVEHLLNKENV